MSLSNGEISEESVMEVQEKIADLSFGEKLKVYEALKEEIEQKVNITIGSSFIRANTVINVSGADISDVLRYAADIIDKNKPLNDD